MKKILIICLLLVSMLIVSCKQTEGPKEPVVTISIVEDTVLDYYYIDEFNITTISIEVDTDGSKEIISLTPLLIENYPSELLVGENTLTINYEGVKKELKINIIEREFYTEGLQFVLNEQGNKYYISGYTGIDCDVVIPSIFNHLEVEGIKSYAFSGNNKIESIYIPDSVKVIYPNAFSNCLSLKNVRLSNNCSEIGDAAFYFCDNLRSVIIPKSVESIGDYAFYNIRLVYTDKEDISSWNTKAFDDNLVCIHKGLDLSKIIKENDFEFYVDTTATLLCYLGNSSEVEIPETVKDVPLTVIGEAAFIQVSDLEEVIISNNIISINDRAFRETGLTYVEIPASVKEIGVYSFSGCEYLEIVKFNEGLEVIKRSAFAACPKLTHAILPDTLTTIEQYGFQNCHSLKQVYIPISVTYIGEGTFYSVGKANLYIEAATAPDTWHPNYSPSAAKKLFGSTRDDLE
jgi:uncharacterized protein (UPF0333 family)